MKRRHLFPPALAVFFLAPVFAAANPAKPISILFVGNSFTFGHADPIMTYNASTVTDVNNRGYGGIPAVFKQFADQAGLDFRVTSETMPSQTLGYHVVNKADVLSQAGWDVVVLQGLSHEPLPPAHGGNPANFFAGAAELRKLILAKNPNARIYLYETWASPAALKLQRYPLDTTGLKAMQDDLRRASFKAVFDQQLTDVLRGGDAIFLANEKGIGNIDPAKIPADGFDLWDDKDHRHASSHGSYLAAAVIFEKITGSDPRRLSAAPGTAAAALGIRPEHAALLHGVAHETNQLPPMARADATTCKPITAVTFNNGIPAELVTADGAITALTAAATAGPSGYRTPSQLDAQTRFFVASSASVSYPLTVTLVGVDDQTLAPFRLVLPVTEGANGFTFSLSDLGVADLRDVRSVASLRLVGDGAASVPLFVGSYAVPAAGPESIFVIGSDSPAAAGTKSAPR